MASVGKEVPGLEPLEGNPVAHFSPAQHPETGHTASGSGTERVAAAGSLKPAVVAAEAVVVASVDFGVVVGVAFAAV